MKTIGIDLGTTNSCVYYLNDDGEPVQITDPLGRKFFPSVVYCAGPGQPVLVGHQAKSRVGQKPAPLVAVKRKMGTTEELTLGGQLVSPVDVSTHILQHAKSLVESATGDKVGAVVVTVPAYFDAAPRKDTYEAAVRAFFDGDSMAAAGRLELQLEPEAAAFAYTLEDSTENLRLLVYDLGGGTFDVTILEKSPDAGLTELKFGGDPHLGGENVDDRVAMWFLYLLRGGKSGCLERIFQDGRYPEEERYTVLLQLLSNDTEKLRTKLRGEDRDLLIGNRPRFQLDLDMRRPDDAVRIQKLKNIAEAAKKALTLSSEASVCEQGAFEDQNGELVDVEFNLSRLDFELLIGDLIARTLDECRRVVAECQMTASDIDRVLLVGGSTRMATVSAELGKIFQCPVVSKDPDLIVARGATLRARDLGVVIHGRDGERQLDLEYPRETPFLYVNIKGRLRRSPAGCRVSLLQDHAGEMREVAEVELLEDRFILPDISLEYGSQNAFHLEVANSRDEVCVEAEIKIRQNPEAVASGGAVTTKITKEIRSQGVRSFKTLFAEGLELPTSERFTCYRATHDDFIRIPFYEGPRHLDDLVIAGIDPNLPEDAAIEVQVDIERDYSVRAVATVLSTQQSQELDFEISRFDVPPLEAMDADCSDVLEQIDNDLDLVRDRNVRAQLARRAKRLRTDYDKARHGLEIDQHKLLATLGEMRKVLAEARGALEFLKPPFEHFEKLLGHCRQLAGRLSGEGLVSPREALDKVEVYATVGKEAWEKEDAATWKAVNADLGRLQRDLDQAVKPPPPPANPQEFPPEAIQHDLLNWAQQQREKLARTGLADSFEAKLASVESLIRQVDPGQADVARNTLIGIAQTRMRPLEREINRKIASLTAQEEDVASSLPSTIRWREHLVT